MIAEDRSIVGAVKGLLPHIDLLIRTKGSSESQGLLVRAIVEAYTRAGIDIPFLPRWLEKRIVLRVATKAVAAVSLWLKGM